MDPGADPSRTKDSAADDQSAVPGQVSLMQSAAAHIHSSPYAPPPDTGLSSPSLFHPMPAYPSPYVHPVDPMYPSQYIPPYYSPYPIHPYQPPQPSMPPIQPIHTMFVPPPVPHLQPVVSTVEMALPLASGPVASIPAPPPSSQEHSSAARGRTASSAHDPMDDDASHHDEDDEIRMLRETQRREMLELQARQEENLRQLQLKRSKSDRKPRSASSDDRSLKRLSLLEMASQQPVYPQTGSRHNTPPAPSLPSSQQPQQQSLLPASSVSQALAHAQAQLATQPHLVASLQAATDIHVDTSMADVLFQSTAHNPSSDIQPCMPYDAERLEKKEYDSAMNAFLSPYMMPGAGNYPEEEDYFSLVSPAINAINMTPGMTPSLDFQRINLQGVDAFSPLGSPALPVRLPNGEIINPHQQTAMHAEIVGALSNALAASAGMPSPLMPGSSPQLPQHRRSNLSNVVSVDPSSSSAGPAPVGSPSALARARRVHSALASSAPYSLSKKRSERNLRRVPPPSASTASTSKGEASTSRSSSSDASGHMIYKDDGMPLPQAKSPEALTGFGTNPSSPTGPMGALDDETGSDDSPGGTFSAPPFKKPSGRSHLDSGIAETSDSDFKRPHRPGARTWSMDKPHDSGSSSSCTGGSLSDVNMDSPRAAPDTLLGSLNSVPKLPIAPVTPSQIMNSLEQKDSKSKSAKKSSQEDVSDANARMLQMQGASDLGQGIEVRKNNHKQAEQRRRDSLKQCFEELGQVLPSLTEKNPSKVHLLKKSFEFIMHLKTKEGEADEQIERLQKDIEQARRSKSQNHQMG
ncbi:uncharacterized protein BJ171DRAFT_233952 [Polychytrium aggregatum]|uniref:uncharacterized protein n=1 Tax=Polychytrium aggregatum TaxID=110093 RepID=UPI0022FE0AC4|nr:uncharacterized protein BJ171DRAFT_233952 [Polychytrium aggregatum]KAI9208075.1 hypothetical protein BJ171DRAFT_233952 [Polychytrium aggregatum]